MSILFPENSLIVYQGSSKSFQLTVEDGEGGHRDITGARIIFTVKQSIEDPRPLIQKTSDNPAQAEITKPREGLAIIYLLPADTANLEPIEYVFDVWVVLSNGKRYPVVKSSIFKVDPSVSLIP